MASIRLAPFVSGLAAIAASKVLSGASAGMMVQTAIAAAIVVNDDDNLRGVGNPRLPRKTVMAAIRAKLTDMEKSSVYTWTAKGQGLAAEFGGDILFAINQARADHKDTSNNAFSARDAHNAVMVWAKVRFGNLTSLEKEVKGEPLKRSEESKKRQKIRATHKAIAALSPDALAHMLEYVTLRAAIIAPAALNRINDTVMMWGFVGSKSAPSDPEAFWKALAEDNGPYAECDAVIEEGDEVGEEVSEGGEAELVASREALPITTKMVA